MKILSPWMSDLKSRTYAVCRVFGLVPRLVTLSAALFLLENTPPPFCRAARNGLNSRDELSSLNRAGPHQRGAVSLSCSACFTDFLHQTTNNPN